MASDTESPDPLETCGWQGQQVGLPLIALLTQAPAAGLTASVSGPAGSETTGDGTLCLVDQNTYQSTDPVYGPTGLAILKADRAVLLIPRAPLASGPYSVDIAQPGQPDIRWSFTADIPVPVSQGSPAINGGEAVGQHLTAFNGGWTGDPTGYAYQWLRCDASGANCTSIPGATGSTYTLTGADAGNTIRLQVIASNSGGASAPAVSRPTQAIWAPPTYPVGGGSFTSTGGSSGPEGSRRAQSARNRRRARCA